MRPLETARHLHLLGATGAVKTVQHEGREHVVVPVVALLEGTIHAVNAAVPEFVPFACLSANPNRWDGKPVMHGHPTKNGTQVSANDPDILEANALGTIFKSCIQNKKLVMEAWIDPVKAEKIGAGRLLERIRKGEHIEVSVGAFVTTLEGDGEHNGKKYKAQWQNITPDHLAFLENGVGACDINMGCGAHRAAAASTTHFISDQGFDTLESLYGIPQQVTELRAACGCQGEHMTKIERIAALMANEHNPLKDQKALETADDTALIALEAHCANAVTLKAASDKLTADKAASDKLAADADAKLKAAAAAGPKEMTQDEFLAKNPELKALVDRTKKADADAKDALVGQLKTAQSEYTEVELAAMELTTLERLARVAKVEPAPDFSGRGVAVPRSAATKEDYTPPSPYDAELKALQAAKVN